MAPKRQSLTFISPQQTRRALKLCEGLPVSILDCDYRDMEIYLQNGQFDKVRHPDLSNVAPQMETGETTRGA